ncbi:YfcE family phosphodiesterase [Candidatus Falkowbacteria bacterium CG10_big_fil_rev_8_21_14_0_10_43_10]|uniref:Phosphoesterase n=1 Tax=Candidatus Falkowbacteria bacterium CG10_big_fil_rev_8_21_14_0_10_43_10 TaxID=1974567 RepID=A0A2H0V4C3_9BACT|nr:MAG: YfcE family phosphodiesterase [Candidatus Falkowbacteria bacterium CG10_big_fil_rev_8_21_14_0_10_43_10]
MKIAIISDTHDNVPNLEKALAWMKENNIEQLIFCGDLCAPSILKEVIAPNFPGAVHMVFGNVEDRELTPKVAGQFKNIKHYGDQGEMEIDGKKAAFAHYPELAKKLAETGKYDFVFYGHNHRAWTEKIGQTELLNPGTLAGMFAKATFAVWDTKTGELELKILEKLSLTPLPLSQRARGKTKRQLILLSF